MRLLLLLFVYQYSSILPPGEIKKIYIGGTAQGTTYHITYYAIDSIVSKSQVDSILTSLDSSLSLYKPYSLVNQFNNSNRGIAADLHLKKVVEKGMETYKNTQGIFDITVYPYTEAWGFGVKKPAGLPDKKALKQMRICVGSTKLHWQGSFLKKKQACVRLDPNGIAQGYSVDVLSDFLERCGIENYLVELGGELRVKGRKPDNSPLKIAIEVPGEDRWDVSLSKKIISLEQGAITTSGSYRKYYESKGKKISHIIDARSGYPAVNELISVTVYAQDAITADAFDNALMVMGLEKALAFVEKRTDIAAHFIYKKADGTIAASSSKRFAKLLTE